MARFGFLKIWKHSKRSFLHVMEGSKVIVPLFCLAARLMAFRVLVSDWPLCGSSGRIGFSFGVMLLILVWASSAHTFGFQHPLHLSLTQSQHTHSGPHWWGLHRSRYDICCSKYLPQVLGTTCLATCGSAQVNL